MALSVLKFKLASSRMLLRATFRQLQRTCRDMDPFKLPRIALFGFSALASAFPNCASADDEVARGKYIVENVAKCSECHSPRVQKEELEKGLSLSGAKLQFKPITPNASWAESAPNIRGIKWYSQWLGLLSSEFFSCLRGNLNTAAQIGLCSHSRVKRDHLLAARLLNDEAHQYHCLMRLIGNGMSACAISKYPRVVSARDAAVRQRLEFCSET
jgi:hypothetical protein